MRGRAGRRGARRTRDARDAGDARSTDAAAATVQRLAVLLAAGVSPATAWEYIDDTVPAVARVRAATAAGESVPEALADDSTGFRCAAAAWAVATTTGAPLAPALATIARALRQLAATQRAVRSALAGPIATTRLVAVLPVIGLLFGAVLGFDTLGVLVGTAPGWLCLAAGGLLMALAAAWTRRLVRAADVADPTAGIHCELMAIAMTGGVPPGRARATVADALVLAGLPATGAEAEADAVVALSVRAGVPAAELLRAEAEDARRRSAAAADRGASVLAVKLMLPLATCVLPAFMVLGVAPLVIAVLRSTITPF